jgi:hypothetical protein
VKADAQKLATSTTLRRDRMDTEREKSATVKAGTNIESEYASVSSSGKNVGIEQRAWAAGQLVIDPPIRQIEKSGSPRSETESMCRSC